MAVLGVAVADEDVGEVRPEVGQEVFLGGGPGGEDDGEGGVEEEMAVDDFGLEFEFGGDGGAEDFGHAWFGVGEGGEGDAVGWAPEGVIDRESDVVET